MPKVMMSKQYGFPTFRSSIFSFLSLGSLLLGVGNLSAHECDGDNCEELFSYSCKEYFEAVGRSECSSLCTLSANELCSGFVDNFLTDRTSIHRSPSCEKGEFLDRQNDWRVHFQEYSDSTSLYFVMDIAGPSHLLGEIEKPSRFSVPAERFRYTVTIRPNWKMHYSFDLQMFSAEINRKGFEAISQEGDRDTDLLDANQYDGFREIDDEIHVSLRKFFKEDEFAICEATRSLTRDKN